MNEQTNEQVTETSQKYNGWPNYETWSIFTNITSYEELLEDIRINSNDLNSEEELKQALINYFYDFVYLSNNVKGFEKAFIYDILISTLERFNLSELFNALKETL